MTSATGPVTFGIRPEELVLTTTDNRDSSENHLKVKIARVMFRPSNLEVVLDAGFPLITYHPWKSDFPVKLTEGEVMWVNFNPEAVVVFPYNE